MSTNTLCDSCRRIIYADAEPHRTRLEVRVLDTPYRHEVREFLLDLCEGCELKVANALYGTLPHLALAIEPNASQPLE